MSIVNVNQVKRSYQQGTHEVQALRGVDLSVEEGEFTVLMGASGSGKTTLLNIIGGLDTADAGSVEVDGHRFDQLSSGQLSDIRLKRLGFVFQAYNLIPVLSAYENAEFVLLLQGMDSGERKVEGRGRTARLG